MNLWYHRIASWDIRVLVCLPRIWSPVTDMQHYYLVRHPTNEWRLANVMSHVYLSVVVCLRGLYNHFVSSRLQHFVSNLTHFYPGLRLHGKKTNIRGWVISISLFISWVRRVIAWTDFRRCHCHHSDGLRVNWIVFPLVVRSLGCVP